MSHEIFEVNPDLASHILLKR